MDTYEDLATDLRQRASQLPDNTQYWIGVAGAPGSGKTTLATELQERLGPLMTIIPMDGYHYYRSELEAMSNPEEAYARRGAPFTFNAAKFVSELIIARRNGEGYFPSFDHHKGDPVEHDIQLVKSTKIVLVEGNYLLLNDEPWSHLRTNVFDESWFLNVPLEESNQRTQARHVQTGLTEEQAWHRVETNDSVNAELIWKVSPENADRLIQLS